MRRVALSSVLAWVIACGAEPAASPAIVTGPETTDLYAASHSALRAPQRTVVTEAADWSSAWDAINAGVSPAPPRPAVDLTKQAVIIAALGERPTGGFAIRIDSVRAVEGGRAVYVTTTRPGPSCITTQAMTQPVHLVSVPATAGATRFVEAETIKDCGS
ncbi:MAG TPA: protease complex subunit PrcB family protein [Gemmatimonadales bacterium]